DHAEGLGHDDRRSSASYLFEPGGSQTEGAPGVCQAARVDGRRESLNMKKITPECRMIDRLVEDRLLNVAVKMPASSLHHLDECFRCRKLYRSFDCELPESFGAKG